LSGENLGSIRRRFTVVIGNLTAETIVEFAETLQARVAGQGYLILSGILSSKSQNVLRCFAKSFFMLQRRRKREWVSFLLQRKC
jgi:ribosomal protein L11 methylase PrmA